MSDVQARLRKELSDLNENQISNAVAAGFTDRSHIEDVVRGDRDGRRMVAEALHASEDELKRAMGWTAWPEYAGVTLSVPCPLGGVLAPDTSSDDAASLVGKQTAVLPDHFSLAKRYQSVRSQLSVGACTAFASVGALEGQHPNSDLSEAFTYGITKSIDGHPDTDGSWLKFSMKAIADWGCCLEQTWPYREDREYLRSKPTAEAFSEAKRYRPRSRVIRVGPNDVSAIRDQISQGHPMPISVPIFRSSYNSLRFHSQGRFLMKLGIFDSVAGYHAMCIIAYFDNSFLVRKGLQEEIGGGAFLVRNSWSETWAKNNPLAELAGAGPGYAIIPFAYIESYCFEAITVAAQSVSLGFDHRRLTNVAAAAGKSWWRRNRDTVVTSARERLAESVK